MPKISNLTKLETAYPDLDDVPSTATVALSVEGEDDYETTIAQLQTLVGSSSVAGITSFNGNSGPTITFGEAEMVALGMATEDYVDTAVAAVEGSDDFSTERTLTHVAGFATADAGKQSLTNMISLSHMAQIATDSFLGRDTASTGNVEVLSAATARSVLDYGSAGKADIGTAITALAADGTAGITLGEDIGTALAAWYADDPAAVRALFASLGLIHATAAGTEGYNVVFDNDGYEVVGIPGINLAALSDWSDVSSSAGTLTLNWASGTKAKRTTSSENTAIVSANLEAYETCVLVVTGGGAHTYTFPAGARVTTGFTSGLLVASGEKYVLVFRHDGTDLIISISTEFEEV